MAINDKISDLDAYSEQVREVLERPPSSIIKIGTGLVLIFLILLGTLSSFISYPDTLTGNVVITTTPAPQRVVVQTRGRLIKILADDLKFVKRGQILAEIENQTHLENLPLLQKIVNEVSLILDNTRHRDLETLTANVTFGDLQEEVNHLMEKYKEYIRLKNDSYMTKRIKFLNREISYYSKLIDLTNRQLGISEKEFVNAEKKYSIDSRLFQEKVYSQSEFIALENTFLQKQIEKENHQKILVEYQIILIEKEKERLELVRNNFLQLQKASDGMQQSSVNIRNKITGWQQNYTITAPISGRIHFIRTIHLNQTFQIGDSLFVVVPAKGKLVGEATVSISNVGKLGIGQLVLINLKDYPAAEFGFVRGAVKQVLLSANNNQYRIIIDLRNGLITDYRKKIKNQPELLGTIEIITEDLSLFERAFYGIRKLLHRT